MKRSVTKIFKFSASHSLPDHDGKCKNDHGHNYVLHVTISGEVHTRGPKIGMIVDYGDIKEIVNKLIIRKVDHKNLNKVFPNMTTTAENLALRILIDLQSEKFGENGRVTKIVLYETDDSYATAEA